jgi:glutaredoxin
MVKVRIYALSTCPWCMKAKAYFAKKGIQFEFLDYDLASKDDQATVRKELEAMGLDLSFPKVFIDGNVISGYRPDEYDKALKVA